MVYTNTFDWLVTMAKKEGKSKEKARGTKETPTDRLRKANKILKARDKEYKKYDRAYERAIAAVERAETKQDAKINMLEVANDRKNKALLARESTLLSWNKWKHAKIVPKIRKLESKKKLTAKEQARLDELKKHATYYEGEIHASTLLFDVIKKNRKFKEIHAAKKQGRDVNTNSYKKAARDLLESFEKSRGEYRSTWEEALTGKNSILSTQAREVVEAKKQASSR